MEFMILREHNLNDLEEAVNDMLDIGWELRGEIIMLGHRDSNNYAIAMTRKKTPEPVS